MDIQKGDLVRLKGGTTIMAVQHIDTEYNLAECVWEEGGRRRLSNYDLDVLEKPTVAKAPKPARARLTGISSPPPTITVPLPPDIQVSLKDFRAEHSDPRKTAFIMMRFAETDPHSEIVRVIQQVTQAHSISAMRADHRIYHDDTFSNIKTYMHGCAFGIAVFERIETDEPNPNVGLEVGYMMALNKPVLLLKDKHVRFLQSDLGGRLYMPFDTNKPAATLPTVINKWLNDKGFA